MNNSPYPPQQPGQGPYTQYPPSGYPQPPMPQPPKKPVSGWLVAIIVIGVLGTLGAISHAVGGDKTSTTITANSGSLVDTGKSPRQPTQVPTQLPTPQPSTRHFKVGDTVNIGGVWQVVISNVRTSPGGQYDSLSSGDTYLLVDAAFKNISDKEHRLYADIDWTLRDADGRKLDNGYNSDSTPPDGKVESGDPAKGTIEYVVPVTAKQFTLAFEMDMFSSGQTIWDLSV